MKKILLASVIATLAVVSANAAVSPYVSLHAGFTRPTHYFSVREKWDYNLIEGLSDDFAYDVSGAVGVKYDISSMFDVRGELEYDFVDGFVVVKRNIVRPNEVWQRSHTLLLNAYVDLKNNTPFTPYISGGIGRQWNHISSDAVFYDGTEYHSTAYQVGTGFAYNMTDNLSLDFGYRYLWSTFAFKNASDHYHLMNSYHQFRLGAMYVF